ncbi:conserved hypothetical protein [Theileria orientalis strain Shintoku]|uniref:Enhancer of polycomb-like protein n=1 Tax=Theileria orientalis strain Shintoku TaxID=869250 RepID=J4D852_THEOR|nr:conserved hypothetical protein [Theileria orientalis strain Shintoku]BAM40575.1 conserved hypothetical protein [Theileria orientalis strain Shintoku]|eukprot:XP_009690876.1 conserved hypothetical protein [Theileria orientalis strain Shintoku]
MPGKIQTGPARKVKTIDLTKELKIIRTRSDFDKFINTQRDGAATDTMDDINSLIDFVVHSKPSNANRTKPINDNVKKKIQVPPTVLFKDENAKCYPFTIPPRYIRYIQTRVTVPGLKLSDNTMVHYNLFKEDKAFIDNFNSRCSDLQLNTNDFLIIMDILEKASAQCHSSKPFSYELGLLVARENGISVPAYILREVHAHWVRRRNEFGFPLIRHLWPQTCPSDASPLALFRPRAKDKMLLRRSRRTQAENVQYLYHLIDGFKRVLKILSKMRQRDEKKLILAELDIVLFDQKRNELIDPTYTCPFWNCILDIKKSRSIRKKKSSSIDESGGNKIKFDLVERNVMGDKGTDLPEAESYKKMRLSRRVGRGGRIWIDRYYLTLDGHRAKGVDGAVGGSSVSDAPGATPESSGRPAAGVPAGLGSANVLRDDGPFAPGHRTTLLGGKTHGSLAASGAMVNGFGPSMHSAPVKSEHGGAHPNYPGLVGQTNGALGWRTVSSGSSSFDSTHVQVDARSSDRSIHSSEPVYANDKVQVGGVWINRHLDEALSITSYDNFDIYNNDMPLDNRPSFANPYESGHFYNTLAAGTESAGQHERPPVNGTRVVAARGGSLCRQCLTSFATAL